MPDNNETEELSFFDMADSTTEGKTGGTKLAVVKLSYDHAEELSWQELFSGYNNLCAITFSSGINFVYKLLGLFDSAEVIFGCEGIISYSLQEIMAYQDKLIERMREKATEAKINLISRIDEGNVRFYVSRTQLSHEKIYLLRADDGRKRVIMGSANMSYNAFGGRQRENICYVDGDAAYDWYIDAFNELKDNSTDEISQKALQTADLAENLDELPIAGTVRMSKALVIEPVKENAEDVRFILDTRNLASSLAPLLPKTDKKKRKADNFTRYNNKDKKTYKVGSGKRKRAAE